MKLASYGSWALITGSAHGLGSAFAQALAVRGLNLLLIDVDGEANARRGAELAERHGIRTHCETLDVSSVDLADRAEELAGAHEIGVLVNNAGVSNIGSFFDTELGDHLRTLETNCRGTLVLTHVVGRTMIERGRGAIVIVSSASALTGTPVVANYAATKAYGLELAAGLWAELEQGAIDVLAVCPGLVRTREIELRPPDLAAAPLVPMMESAEVAESALTALEAGRGPVVVPGWHNRLSAFAMARLAPRRAALRLLRSTMRKLYPDAP